MKNTKSIHQLFLETVEERQSNFDNIDPSEPTKVMNIILDQVLTEDMPHERRQRKINSVVKFVNLQFFEKNRRSQSLKKLVK